MLSIHRIPEDDDNLSVSGSHTSEEVSEEKSEEKLVKKKPNKSSKSKEETKFKKEGLLLMKGAAEQMIGRCTYIVTDKGLSKFTDKQKKEALALQEEMCNNGTLLAHPFPRCTENSLFPILGERVLGFIMKTINHTKQYPIYDPNFNTDDYTLPIEDGFTFVGLMALLDPPRPEVAGVIQKCHKAGIKVSMVTGDHPGTAVTIGTINGGRGLCGVVYIEFLTHSRVASMIGIVKDKSKCESMADYVAGSRKMINPAHTYAELNRVSIEQPQDIEMGKSNKKAVVVVGKDLAIFTDDHWDWVLSHRDIVFVRLLSTNQNVCVCVCVELSSCFVGTN